MKPAWLLVAMASIAGGSSDSVHGAGLTSSCSTPGAYPTSATPAAAGPRNVVVADFDRAGGPDLAVLNTKEGTLAVLTNRGDGSFDSPAIYPGVATSGGVRGGLTAGDFDGANGPDVAYTRSLQVMVRYNQGSGILGPEVVLPSGRDWVAAADLDGVNGIDLISGNESGLSVFLNDGSGGFPAAISYASGSFTLVGHAIADLDGDGDLDVLTSGPTDAEAFIRFFNDGAGVFGSPQRITGTNIGRSCVSLAVADLDGANGPDILCNDVWSRGVTVYLANASSSYNPPAIYGSGLSDILNVADMDCMDGPDVVYSTTGGTVNVLLNRGAGTFLPEQVFPAGVFATASVVADLNRSGGLDWAATSGVAGSVTVSLDCVVSASCVPEVWLLRNDEIDKIDPLDRPLATVFRVPGGSLIENSSVAGFKSGQLDPDVNVVRDAARPLVFYQVTRPDAVLRLSRVDDRLKIEY